ncbi:MAG: ATP-dependent DNA ligase, partial [Micrococcales bacterium]|nr:ATP-dependent DNA ligase [Micrococcales bacterium]
MSAKGEVLNIAGPGGVERTVNLSNPDKPVWPGDGQAEPVTKRDLVDYLLAVREPFLRAVGDRPVTLQRFRGGIAGEEFYSKNPPKGAPAWIRTVICTYPSGRQHPQLVIDEIAGA